MKKIEFTSDKFNVYGGYPKLQHGVQATIEVSIYPEIGEISDDIAELLKQKNLEEVLDGRKNKEEEIYNRILQSMQEWVDCAQLTAICHRALEYKEKNKQQIKHTNNVWVEKCTYDCEQEISNNVYQMTCSLWETKDNGKVVYYATWDVYIRGLNYKQIAGQRRKRYTDKEKALQYIEGRKKAYSHLFEEVSPAIPKEHEWLFKKNGILLEGYRVDDE